MWRALLCAGVVALGPVGCATAPPPLPAPSALFDDARFAAPAAPIDPGEVFALSDAMRRYLHEDLAPLLRREGRLRGLVEALGSRAQLRLEYDAATTRTAAEAFEARAGNCLALVVMTAALARELGLPVQFQSAYVDETWSRSSDLFLRSGHVNLTIGPPLIEAGRRSVMSAGVTVDFLPPERAKALRTRRLDESTVVAMFMNNRAVEALRQGRLDDAYWRLREALRADPTHAASYNTLGVVYLRHGALALAERAFAALLEREPENEQALANLAQAMDRAGRAAEAAALRERLARVEPHPPFHFFELGRAAMARGEFAQARTLFAREVARDPYYHEFQFWLALAHFRLGDEAQARRHLALAAEYGLTRGERDLYAAKLASLRANHH